ncbi:Protein ABIL1 [Striga hermonthica]|uniref:Protein ABIL1 n=1 Tax=Striga hermonthica TaxID=68872 RepID=A0A9N7N2A3_STRHE|nr:Protein ABIL1 [Striga hermonthica]
METGKQTATFEEMSVEKSKSFVTALQELKNLIPQLYSAAEYCEKSYLNNEQKQTFMDNMKDYAVRALVNAIDHLGTVSYKLSDVIEQQTLEISSIDLKVTCLNQQQHEEPQESSVPHEVRVNVWVFACVTEICCSMEAGKQTASFEEMSVEKSKSFVTALQELKNLRPQLYSAAEYCEKSYLNSEQKQTFMDNLKDYAVRALVNAIDHLGTVSYKLSDVIEQQTLEISSIDLKVTCLNQKLLTCQTYTEKEGLRQQQLLAIIPKHHKHYTLPNSFNKKVHFNPHIQTGPRKTAQVRDFMLTSDFFSVGLGASAAKTLSWHMASESKSTLKGSSRGIMRLVLEVVDARENKKFKSAPATRVAMQTLGVTQRDPVEGSKPVVPYKSFCNTTEKDVVRPPVRSKSMISAFFVKQKGTGVRTNA